MDRLHGAVELGVEGGTFERSAEWASDGNTPSVMRDVSHGGGNMRQVHVLSASDDAGAGGIARQVNAGRWRAACPAPDPGVRARRGPRRR